MRLPIIIRYYLLLGIFDMSAQRITTLGTFIWAIGTLFYTFEMLIKSSVSAMSGIFIDGFAFTGVQLSWIGSTFYLSLIHI